jgi:hypothetical protein
MRCSLLLLLQQDPCLPPRKRPIAYFIACVCFPTTPPCPLQYVCLSGLAGWLVVVVVVAVCCLLCLCSLALCSFALVSLDFIVEIFKIN